MIAAAMARHTRRLIWLLMLSAGATLAFSSRALAVAPVQIATLPSGLTPAAVHTADVGKVGYYTALYVDLKGTAHVAYVTPDYKYVVTCSIPAGGHSCVGAATLATDAAAANQGDALITSIKYLVDPGGNGLLAVGIYNLTAPGQPNPYSETEIFSTLAGASGGQRVGSVFDAGPRPGDTIVEPDDSGVEVVGNAEPGPSDCGLSSPPYYAFESLVKGGQSSGAISLGTENTQPSCSQSGWTPFDLTKLPGGQTAVFGSLSVTSASPFATPADGIRVAPTLGAPFGPWRQLGINGSLAAVSAPAPGGTYVLNVENSQQFEKGTNAAPMQLWSFRGTGLRPPVSIGQASDVTIGGPGWRELPPISEDANGGNVRIGWLTRGTHDGCPAAKAGLPTDDTCLMYRLVEPGLRLGPKVVLSVQPSINGSSPENSSTIAGLGPISADSSGVGWMLVFRGANVSAGQPATLYAQPLVDAAAARGSVKVHGSSVSTALSCAHGSGCPITAQLSIGGRRGRLVRASGATTSVIGSVSLTLRGGQTKTIVVRLNARGRGLRAPHHRLSATLLITEKVGVTRAVVVDQHVTFKTR